MAVARDIKKLFKRVPTSTPFFNKPENRGLQSRLRRYVRSSNLAAVREVLGEVFHTEPRVLVGIDRALHGSHRTKAGAVPGRPKKSFVIPNAAISNYTKERQKLVGFMKAGWKRALVALGVSLPAWVSRHDGANGSFEDRLNSSSPSFSMTNRSTGIPRFRSLVAYAMRARVNAMKRDLDKWARVRGHQFNRA